MFQKILVIQLRQLGDILLTTPCITCLRQAFPKAHIAFLSHPMGKLVLEHNPYLDRIHYYTPQSWQREFSLAWQLRQEGFDLVVDFMFNPRSALYSYSTAAACRASFMSRRSWAYTHLAPRLDEPLYIVEEKQKLLQSLGIEAHSLDLVLPCQDSDRQLPRQWLSQHCPSPHKPRVIVSCTHRRPVRQWPLQHYARLADDLVKSFDAEVIWVWGPGEQAFVSQAMQLCAEPMHLAPATKFRELAALMQECHLFIGNSNGPSHVAVASQLPSIQLHGPTAAISWCPPTDKHLGLQSQDGSMEGLSYDQVWQALEAHWDAAVKQD